MLNLVLDGDGYLDLVMELAQMPFGRLALRADLNCPVTPAGRWTERLKSSLSQVRAHRKWHPLLPSAEGSSTIPARVASATNEDKVLYEWRATPDPFRRRGSGRQQDRTEGGRTGGETPPVGPEADPHRGRP